MTQKIISIGNSAGVVLPAMLRQELQLEPGDRVTIEKKDKSIVVTPVKKDFTGKVDAAFMKLADEFIEEHKDVLIELAEK